MYGSECGPRKIISDVEPVGHIWFLKHFHVTQQVYLRS